MKHSTRHYLRGQCVLNASWLSQAQTVPCILSHSVPSSVRRREAAPRTFSASHVDTLHASAKKAAVVAHSNTPTFLMAPLPHNQSTWYPNGNSSLEHLPKGPNQSSEENPRETQTDFVSSQEPRFRRCVALLTPHSQEIHTCAMAGSRWLA